MDDTSHARSQTTNAEKDISFLKKWTKCIALAGGLTLAILFFVIWQQHLETDRIKENLNSETIQEKENKIQKL